MNKYIVSLLVICSMLCASSVKAEQLYFSTPQAAVKELIVSIKEKDMSKLLNILGSDAKPILDSGDPIEDEANHNKFLKACDEENKLEKVNEVEYQLTLGKDHWEFPIPLLKGDKGWYFDTNAGKQEILNRRVGRNELSAINAVLAYVDAQREYYMTNPEHAKMNTYAQKLMSSPNKRDGLYYPVNAGETPSPLGDFFAQASSAGYGDSKGKQQPYLGYYYRILKSQGKDALGGELDYVMKDKMISGHALIAWPAEYGNSGVMTFMVGQDGVVYEKDLGPHTTEDVAKITKYNPDKTWKVVK
ncbi:DUF2950 family protein [Candidatus Berkiella aquae]|uniref:DUF2950 domain-containing protein n=1 Tax=Candidatus Berkiella aquae TaxID=295108 RepID=A0A0Q9YRX1_9GAMM|nr:DUF2950 domain-containing protein [Candidatus Berkiella aquae]MCS5711986.1 DUF2950 domain-containing protein [Candidatus Berkiella aquae]